MSLCRILYELGASLECENEFQWKPLQIAQCWNRTELVQFLQNPKEFEPEVFSPTIFSAQEIWKSDNYEDKVLDSLGVGISFQKIKNDALNGDCFTAFCFISSICFTPSKMKKMEESGFFYFQG